MDDIKNKPDSYWKEKLSPEQYKVLREKGTEIPFTGKYVYNKEEGTYVCAACGQILFSSDTKYDSGCGWPSFYDLAKAGTVELKPDYSHFMIRTEVVCSNCGSHLGHVFDIESTPSGKWYCINSTALKFKKEKEENSKREDREPHS